MKKLFTLMLVTVTTLTALGVGYALWSETLTITGTVETGTVNIDFSEGQFTGAYDDESMEANGDVTPANGGDPDTTVENKGVGTCTETGNEAGDNSYTFTVGNAYPSYDCWVAFDIHYDGSIPAHVAVVSSGNMPEAALHWSCTYDDDTADATAAVAISGGPEYLATQQLHDGAELDCVLRIHFTNDDNLTQGVTYTYGLSIQAGQYNEGPIGGPFPTN